MMGSPARSTPPCNTMAMTPDLRISPPAASRPSIAAITPGLEMIKLRAGIAEPGDFHDRFCPKAKPRTGAKPEQIKPARCHILTNIAGLERKTLGREFFEDFRMQQMKLAQIGL